VLPPHPLKLELEELELQELLHRLLPPLRDDHQELPHHLPIHLKAPGGINAIRIHTGKANKNAPKNPSNTSRVHDKAPKIILATIPYPTANHRNFPNQINHVTKLPLVLEAHFSSVFPLIKSFTVLAIFLLRRKGNTKPNIIPTSATNHAQRSELERSPS
jgi:hypothetical protein